MEFDPYKLYSQDNLLNSNPVALVVALYQGAIDSIGIAKECLKSRDIPGRTKAANKVYNILTELLGSLDHEKGKEISKNLAGLYTYMQKRVLDAHHKQRPEPLDEVEKLLSDLLVAWRQASLKYDPFAMNANAYAATTAANQLVAEETGDISASFSYGNYVLDYGDFAARQAYSF